MMLAREVSASSPQAVPAPLLAIRLFGTPGVTVEGKPLPSLRSRKGLYLLALLALSAGRERDRAYLAGRLWPDSEESLALANLRRTLTDLKSALGAASDCLASPTPRSLRLETGERVRIDVAVFDAACDRGDDLAALEEAVRVYGGPLLEGDEEEWIYAERLNREQAYIATLERLAGVRRGRGEFAEAVPLYRRAVLAEPLRESAHRGLMEALARSGNFAGALEAYRDLRLLLHREINSEPDPETRALFESLRAQQQQNARPATAVPSPGASLPYAGMPTVADTDGPVRLPLSVSAFIGRQAELDLVAEWLSAHRLVTLVGAGGVGKTRLSIESARRAAPDFPDGIYFVDLAPLADPSLVPQAVAAVLQIADGDGSVSPRELLLRVLEPRRALIILDNCEHLLAACAELADLLLRRCPHLRLIATSRQPLGIVGEGVWRVPPLSLPADEDLPEEEPALAEAVAAHDATRLFVARATAVSPHFAPTGRQARALVEVCRRLDGIALAIELAAARVRVLTVEQIAARLDDRFRLLTSGDRTALPRQQTLRALIDWSYDLLPPRERALLARLSVFTGGFTLEGAEKICPGGEIDADDVLDLLSELVDRSLVLFDDTGAAESGVGRYRMQETIRQYAAQRLSCDEAEATALRDAHLAYFAERADVGENGMTGGEQARWTEFYGQEWANLRAAWEWAVARGDHDRMLILPAGSWRYLRARGLLTYGRAWVEEALARAEPGAAAPIRKRAHTSAGNLAMTQGDLTEARRHIEAVIAVSEETGDEFGVALAGTNLGILAEMAGEHERARDLLEANLPFFRRTNRTENVATALYNLSIVQSELGEWQRSRAAVEESLALRRKLEDRRGIAISLNHVALLDLQDGDLDAAWGNARECLMIARSVSHRMTEATIMSTLGTVALRRADYGVARSLLAQSLRMFRQMESPGDTIIVLENFAVLAAEEGKQGRAARLFGAVATLRERTGFRGLGEEERAVAREALRGAMGADRFDSYAREGSAFEAEQATEYALTDVPASDPTADPLDVL